jgi:hypothetical protein
MYWLMMVSSQTFCANATAELRSGPPAAVHLLQKRVYAAVDEPHLLPCRLQFPQELGFLLREVGHSLVEVDEHLDHSHKGHSLAALELGKLDGPAKNL